MPISVIGSSATATFTTADEKTETFKIRGNWLDKNAEVIDEKHHSQVVAKINRKILNTRDLVFGQQTYAVEIAPGVDAAIIAALCICFDEKNNDQRND